jgi:Ca-activated chloride channel homolog
MTEAWYSSYWFRYTTFASFEWESPYFLYGILIVPFLFWLKHLFNNRSRQRLNVALADTEHITFNWVTYLRHLPNIAMGWAIVMILIALARPQKVTEQTERFSDGIDIVLAIDVSSSMLMSDIKPTRLEAAKKVAKSFIEGRFQDRIGLVIFAGNAYFLSPLTTDYEALYNYLGEINSEAVSLPGTAIGNAVGRCINLMRDSPTKSKVAILLSDGDNTAGELDPIMAARLARAFGVKVYTIAVGTGSLVKVNLTDTTAVHRKQTGIDESLLREVATTTNGRFFRATDSHSLKQIFDQINHLEKAPIKNTKYREVQDMYHAYLYWAIIGILCMLFFKSTFIGNVLED